VLAWCAIVGAQKGVAAGISILGCILPAVVGPTAGRWYVNLSSGGTLKHFMRGGWFVSIAALTGVVWILYRHGDRRPVLGRKGAGKSQRELRDLGLLVEDGNQPAAVAMEAGTA
jgi:hypothetical protein